MQLSTPSNPPLAASRLERLVSMSRCTSILSSENTCDYLQAFPFISNSAQPAILRRGYHREASRAVAAPAVVAVVGIAAQQ